jgi:hypothetical protein
VSEGMAIVVGIAVGLVFFGIWRWTKPKKPLSYRERAGAARRRNRQAARAVARSRRAR